MGHSMGEAGNLSANFHKDYCKGSGISQQMSQVYSLCLLS